MFKFEPVRKTILLLLIAASFFPFYYTLSVEMNFAYHVSKTAAYAGFLTLWWAYVLGIRRFIGIFIKDMEWVMFIHKWFNIIGFLLLLLHPLTLSISVLGLDLWLPKFGSAREWMISAGILALIMWAVIWITSAALKGKLKFRPWKFIHLFTYPILFLGFYHMQAGFLIKGYRTLEYFDWVLFAVFVLLVVWQIAGRVGVGISKYIVSDITIPSAEFITLTIAHVSGQKMKPHPGQYVYLQLEPGGESHPFSISDFNQDTGEIEITIKDLGPFSNRLQTVEEGTVMIVDGPYGIFLSDFDKHKGDIVFIAGGVGITPFAAVIRNLRKANYDPEAKIYLFYGSHELRDAIFNREIERLEQQFTDFDIIPVLDHAPEYQGEKGFITTELIGKYVQDLHQANFFLCGPPMMVSILVKQLKESGVAANKIDFENFSA